MRDSSLDWAATPEANVLFGKWFYVVPDNSKLKRRVKIEVENKEGVTLAASSCTSSECYPKRISGSVQIQGQDRIVYDVCGEAAACIQMNPNPGFKLLQKN